MTTAITKTQTSLATSNDIDAALFARAQAFMLDNVAASSGRVYADTLQRWATWALVNNTPLWAMTPENVIAFIKDHTTSRTTAQRLLSTIRQMLRAAHSVTLDDRFNRLWALLQSIRAAQLIKNPAPTTRRTHKALKPLAVHEAFSAWPERTNAHLRNRAILAVAFYAGLRRFELAALRWADIDLDAGLVIVRHGKGDKARTVPFAGGDNALAHLQAWQAAQTAANGGQPRDYVFCSVSRHDHLGQDKPISGQAVYDVVLKSGDFAPHDARRTLITAALNAGTPLADVQFIAGHSSGSTTLRYAVVSDANAVKGRVKIDY